MLYACLTNKELSNNWVALGHTLPWHSTQAPLKEFVQTCLAVECPPQAQVLLVRALGVKIEA